MARISRSEINDLVVVFKDTFYSIADEFGERVSSALDDNLAEFNQKVLKDVVKDFNSLARISSDITKNNESIISGTLKRSDIEKQIARRRAKIQGIEAVIATTLQKGTAERAQANKLLKDANEAERHAIALLEAQSTKLKDIESKSGAFTRMAKGVKSIPALGPILQEPFEKGAKAAREAAVNSGYLKTQLAGVKGVASGLIDTLSFPLVVDSILLVNSQLTDVQRNLGISHLSARAVRMEFAELAKTTNLTQGELLEANQKFGDFLGTRGVFTKGLVEELSTLTEIVGLSGEQVNRLGSITQGLGTPLGEFNNKIAESAVLFASTQGVALNTKDVFEEISNMSTTTLLNLGRNPQRLAEAVVQSRKLALNFQQLENIASGMLDFESSIGAELEAELLTGKQLNLERARFAALTGDVETLQREIAKNIPPLAQYERMAPIQRQAYAKALSMSDEELGNILLKNEAINANASIANKLTQQQIADAKKLADIEGIGFGEALKRTQEQLNAQQTLERFMKKMRDAFSNLTQAFEPLLDKVVDMTNNFMKSKFLQNVVTIGTGVAVMGKLISAFIPRGSIANPMYVVDLAGGGTGGGGGGIFGSGKGKSKGPLTKSGRPDMRYKANQMPKNVGKFGKVGKFLGMGGKVLGIAGALIGPLTSLYSNLSDTEAIEKNGYGKQLLKSIDENKFAALGAVIGSVVPGIGTLIGAGIGSLVDIGTQAAFGQKALVGSHIGGGYDDFIMRPGQAPVRFNKDDLIIGGTNLDGTSKNSASSSIPSLEATNKKLLDKIDKLIAAVERGGNVYMDSNKVGRSLVLGSYQSS